MSITPRLELFALVVSVVTTTGCGGNDTSPLGLAEADRLVLDELLPPELPIAGDWVATRLSEALPQGTELGNRIDAFAAFAPVLLEEPSYLYVLDPSPGALPQRPLRFLIVGQSGAHTILDGTSSPLIDGLAHDELLESPPRADLLLGSSTTWGALETGNQPIVIPALEVPRVFQRVIVVNGAITHEGNAGNGGVQAWVTYRAQVEFWTAYSARDAAVTVSAMEQSNGSAVLAEIDDAAATGNTGIALVVISPYGTPVSVQTAGGNLLLGGLIDRLRAHPTVKFSLMLAFSGARAWLPPLALEPNVEVFLTAATPEGYVMADFDFLSGIPDVDPADAGFEYPSAWLRAAATYTASNQAFTPVRTLAVEHGTGMVPALICLAARGAIGQRPQDGLDQYLDLTARVSKAFWHIYCPTLGL